MTRCFGRTGERAHTAIGSEQSDHRKMWTSGNFPARECVIRPHFQLLPPTEHLKDGSGVQDAVWVEGVLDLL